MIEMLAQTHYGKVLLKLKIIIIYEGSNKDNETMIVKVCAQMSKQ